MSVPDLSRLAALAFALAGAGAPASAHAGETTLSGSVRLRYEAVAGQPRAGLDDDDDLLNLRTRLEGEHEAGPWRFGAEFVDSRVWLADAQTPVSTGDVNTAELVQLYAAFATQGPAPMSVQAGRFTLNVGSRRLVASDDYRNTTNGYTGLRFDVGDDKGPRATLLAVLPQVRLPEDGPSLRDGDIVRDRESDDLALYGAIAAAPLGPGAIEATALGLRERDRPDLATRDRDLATYGLRYVREPRAGAWDVDVEVLRQTGTTSASAAPGAATLDVDAHFAHAELGYRWAGGWKPRLAVEYDIASGDDRGADFGRFDTLFGMRRAEFAPSGLYNAVGRANVVSPGLRLEVEPSPRLDAFIAYRALRLASATDSFSTTGVRDPTGASGRFAGHQIDARVRVWLKPRVWRFDANVVYLDKGRFLRRAPNAPASGDATYVAFDLTRFF